MNAQNIKVIVFDLDGTLYSETSHFAYYAERLKERLPRVVQDDFMRDYRAAEKKKHVIKVGRVYDVLHDLILVHCDRIVTEAYEWNGYKIPEERVKWLYPEPLVIDNERQISIGDFWWVPVPIAYHYGLDFDACHEAFLETRHYMMSPDFTMKKIPGLKETLEKLRTTNKLVLLTNSPEPDSRAILRKLDLDALFDQMIFNGKKPAQTLKHFEAIKEAFAVEYGEILSVGDNWVNEIYPVQKLGVKTLFINTHELSPEHQADVVVTHPEAIVAVLRRMAVET